MVMRRQLTVKSTLKGRVLGTGMSEEDDETNDTVSRSDMPMSEEGK